MAWLLSIPCWGVIGWYYYHIYINHLFYSYMDIPGFLMACYVVPCVYIFYSKKKYFSIIPFVLPYIVFLVMTFEHKSGVRYVNNGYSFVMQPHQGDTVGYMEYKSRDIVYKGMSERGGRGEEDRVRDGYGVATWADGRRFEGVWEHGRVHKGIYTWPDGTRFEGTWERTGGWSFMNTPKEGIYYYTDGSVFMGSWVDEQDMKQRARRRTGIFFYPSGAVVDGEWIDVYTGTNLTNMIADGIFYKYGTDGFCTKMRYEKDKSIGFVERWFAHNGKVGDEYFGRFREDEKTGYGWFRYTNGRYYQGFFTKGKFNGEGTLYNYNDEVIRTGKWNNEEPMDFYGDCWHGRMGIYQRRFI